MVEFEDLLKLRMTRGIHIPLLSFSSIFFLLCSGQQWAAAAQSNHTFFQVGVILDMSTMIGSMGWSCISMALDDFYVAHPDYKTRLALHLRDSDETSISAASAALDLLKNVQVQAIIGPQGSTQAKFVLELGKKTQVPIISFSAKSPSLSSSQYRYFIRTAMNDSSQAKAIAAIVQTFGWRQVVPIFEDTEYGNGIIPYLVDAFKEIDTHVPYRGAIILSATKERILEELYKLKTMQTRVFIVHATYKLGLLLFSCAKEAGMMEEGFVWITTYGLTDIVDFMESSISVMQGVLGVKPYVHSTKLLSEFKVRWRRNFLSDNPHVEATEPSVFGLWAYDALWALATAIESIGVGNSSFQHTNVTNTSVDLEHLGSSTIGPKLLNSLLNINFNGVSGKFQLVEGQLQSTTMEIVNVIGKGKRRIGFWMPALGISGHLDSKADLRLTMWPGERTTVPKGWEWPTRDKKLKIGVPVKAGFSEFVKVERDPLTNKSVGSGFCIEVFDAVMAELPYAVLYEYIPFENAAGESNGTYDDLIYEVYLQNYDVVVGDMTIIANRSRYVDFTLPFTESGVSMVVPMKDDRSKKAWVFLKPLTAGLWLASGAFFVFTGFVVWVLEHRINEEFRGPPAHQLGTTFYFTFSTLVFAHKEKLVSNLSKVVVIIWVFVVLILTSSYTASLTSMLTVQQLQPTVTNMNELLKSGANVGYLNDSFMPGLLKRLKFDEAKLKAYNSPDKYAEALSKGSLNGGVSAIVDEIPYIKVFLSRYCGKYTMVGPTYKTDGFGFVFPKGSPLVPDVSRAILKVTEGEKMTTIENKLYGDHLCLEQSSTVTSNNLTLDSFSGLFLITGIASASALILFLVFFVYKNRRDLRTFLSENSFLQSLSLIIKFYDQRDPSSMDFKKTEPCTEQLTAVGGVMATPNPFQSPSSLSTRTYGNFDTEEEEEGGGSPAEEEGTPGREIASQYPDPPSLAEMLNGIR